MNVITPLKRFCGTRIGLLLRCVATGCSATPSQAQTTSNPKLKAQILVAAR